LVVAGNHLRAISRTRRGNTAAICRVAVDGCVSADRVTGFGWHLGRQ
jgi:hypothetical protein